MLLETDAKGRKRDIIEESFSELEVDKVEYHNEKTVTSDNVYRDTPQ